MVPAKIMTTDIVGQSTDVKSARGSVLSVDAIHGACVLTMLILDEQRSDLRNRSGRYTSIICPTGRTPVRLISLEAWADSSALFFCFSRSGNESVPLLSVASTALKPLAVLTRSVAAYVAPSAEERAKCPSSVISLMITSFRLPFFCFKRSQLICCCCFMKRPQGHDLTDASTAYGS